jgi:hypothetical protein
LLSIIIFRSELVVSSVPILSLKTMRRSDSIATRQAIAGTVAASAKAYPQLRQTPTAENDLTPVGLTFPVNSSGVFIGYYATLIRAGVVCFERVEAPGSVRIEIWHDRCYITDLMTQFGTYIGQCIIPPRTAMQLKENDILSISAPRCDMDEDHEITLNSLAFSFVSAKSILSEHKENVEKMECMCLADGLARVEVDVNRAIKEQMVCDVCREWYIAPCLIGGCGHKFCYACIQRWFSGRNVSCPTCRSIPPVVVGYQSPLLIPCFTTEELLQQFVDPRLSLDLVKLRRKCCSMGFAAIRTMASHACSSTICQRVVGFRDAGYSLDQVTDDNDRSSSEVAGPRVTCFVKCSACFVDIPSGFARMLSRSGHHYHASFPCIGAMRSEIKHAEVAFDGKLSAQEYRVISEVITYMKNLGEEEHLADFCFYHRHYPLFLLRKLT